MGGYLDTLRRTGHTAYPVGGYVRDLLLGQTPGDFDICTDAWSERVMEFFPRTTPTDLRHGTITMRTENGPMEVTALRREAGYAGGRHPDVVDFDVTLAKDLARWDFTVNAMALDESGMVIDRYGGQMDLFRSVIRCVGDPGRRSVEDALRMLRAARFAVQLGFPIEKGTLDAIRHSARRAEKLSGERIKAELEKILLSFRPELAGELPRSGLLVHLEGRPNCPGLLALRKEPSKSMPRRRAFCHPISFPITVLPVERALRQGVLHPEAEAVRTLALPGGELAALGLEGPAIDAAQRRLAAHILAHPEDNTPAQLLALARAELSGPQGWPSSLGQARTPSSRYKHQGRGGTAMEWSGKWEGLLGKTAKVFDLPGDAVAGLPRIELTGSRELRMEDHKEILSYGSEEIHISGGKPVVKVRGSGLELRSMNASQLLITGVITAAELEQGGGGMLKRVVNALWGSVRLEVSGAFPERSFNLCAQRGIVFWNVKRLEATRLRLTVTRQGSDLTRALGDKMLYIVVLTEQSGVSFFPGWFRWRYALLVGLVPSLMAVCVLSQLVFTTEVEGNEAVSMAEILTELRQQGLRPGVYSPGLDEGTISSAALLGLPELAWMSVNLHGTRAEALVREAVSAPEVDDEKQVGSIVARPSGIVTHIEPLSGEALVAQEDMVLAGEVLTSGAVTLDAPQYSEPENLGQILVWAQGQAFVRMWYTITALIPLEAQVKSHTGEKASRWTLSILGRHIDLFGKSGISFPGYNKITDTWMLTLSGGREIPPVLSRETCRAYTLVAASVDADAAERPLEERPLEAFRARLRDGEVVHTSLSSAQRDGRLEVTLQAECTEEAGRFASLESVTEENEAGL